MAKRGNHFGFAVARVNANVESRVIIAEALALETERYEAEPVLPDTCVNFMGDCCPCCGGCVCPSWGKFAVDFMAKQGKTLNTARR